MYQHILYFLKTKKKTIHFECYLFRKLRSNAGVGIVQFGLGMDPDTTLTSGKRDDAAFRVGVGFGFGDDYISAGVCNFDVCSIKPRSRQGAKAGPSKFCNLALFNKPSKWNEG